MSRAVRFAVGAAAHGRRGRGARHQPSGPGAVRGLHGGGDHAGRRRRAGRPDLEERGQRRVARHGSVHDGAGRVDLSALAAPALAEHGGGAHLDPPARDGPEQHDRDGVRGRDAGGGRGVSADRARRRRRDAGRRLRQPARSPASGGVHGHEGGQHVDPAADRGLAAVRRRARRLRAGRRSGGARARELPTRPAARRADLRRDHRLRLVVRRLRHHPAGTRRARGRRCR